ncbi:IclR family transcriptional regulator [Lacisediminimonas sp.]|uniref:IclR family transcriptional regulator n=1 Tax=Lacisediminimonas sp. TaxID=3060582 RepID=UPI00271878BB|nr:IclR family transcriptional regulator [Lacisediminimonas sp.]MDO8301310.1 IclR family transcriptional regulator [Lacisediminimonas sp.]
MDKTLLKGLSLLEELAQLDGAHPTIEQLAERVGLTRSNTHRTLQTLVHAGFVERDPVNGGYCTTMKLFALGVRQINRLDLRKIAQPQMAMLARQSGETVHLSVLDNLDVIYIDKIDSVQPIHAYSIVGGRAPAYAVATGKALLAAEGDACLARLPGQLKSYTSSTVTDLAVLEKELKKAAKNGYAINRGEWRNGVGGLASPVFNGLQRPIAALGISGPTERLTLARMRELAPMVVEAARQVSQGMGYQPA